MKKVIIVGATSGIGKGIANLMADNDYLVGITGRRTLLLEEIKSQKPESYRLKTFDTTQTSTIALHLDELTSDLGGLDTIIICSGTGDLNEKLDFELEKRTIDTNVSGFTAVADWAFNYFSAQKYGHLAAITSIAGIRGNRQAPAYSASKAFQLNYLEGLRMKASKAAIPIFITDIRPGFVDTRMAKGQNMFWVANVRLAASQIFNAILEKRKVVYITKRWVLIAWLLKRLPNWILEKF